MLKTGRNAGTGEVKRAVVISVASTLFVSGLGFAGYLRFAGAVRVSEPSCEISSPEQASGDRARQSEAFRTTLAAIVAARTIAKDRPPTDQDTPMSKVAPAPEMAENAPSWTPPTKEERAAKRKADLQSLEAQLLREEVDPRWTSKMADATSTTLDHYGSMHLDEMTCRETLCRARIKHLDLRSHDEDVERILGLPFIMGQSVVYDDPEAPGDSTLYFSRDGTQLSALQDPIVMQPPPGAFTAENGDLRR